MDQDELDPLTDELRVLIAERLNVRARSFAGAVAKAGRLLPPDARTAAAEIEAMQARLRHPKLAAQTDSSHAQAAADRIRRALSGRKPGNRAARDLAFLLAEIAFRILIVLVAVLALTYWLSP